MLRAVTYNIKLGGSGGRLPAILDVVRSLDPDVLALQELRGFDKSTLDSMAASLGMRGFLARSWLGQPVAVLVRKDFPVHRTAALRIPFHHAAMVVTMSTHAGPLTVVSTHLCPYSGRRRLWEARRLRRFGVGRGSVSKGMALLMGDLNTLEPDVDHSVRLAELPSVYRRRHLRRNGAVDSRAVSTLLSAGFVDLARTTGQVERTAPTEHGGGPEFRDMRLDYVLATRSLAERAADVSVMDGGLAEHASDHYPVMAIFDLD
jgi:exodeoxyribonuclease III